MALMIPPVTPRRMEQMQPIFEMKHENVSEILERIMNCLSQNNELTFQDVEAGFRQAKSHTYLIAHTPNKGANVEWPPGTKKTYEINLNFSEDGKFSYEAGSYEENYRRLADSGISFTPSHPQTQILSKKKSSCCIIA